MEINRKIFNIVQNEIDNTNVEIRFLKAFGEGTRYGIMYITREDEVYGVGYNGDFNLLGISGEHFLKKRVEEPVKVVKLCGKNIKHVSFGDHLAVGLGALGELYEWGLPYSGMRSSYDRSTIQLPHLKTSCTHFVTTLDCGGGFFATITNRQKVFVWGYIDWSAPFSDGRLFSPMHKEVDSIACGTWHMIMLTTDGKVYSCGHGGYGQLGYDWNVENGYWKIGKIPLTARVVKIVAGSVSTICVTESGELWAFGLNHPQFGYLGVESEEPNITTPSKIKIDEPVRSVAVSYSLGTLKNAYAASTPGGGKFYVWGWGSSCKFPIKVETPTSFVKFFDALPTPPQLCLPDAPDGEEKSPTKQTTSLETTGDSLVRPNSPTPSSLPKLIVDRQFPTNKLPFCWNNLKSKSNGNLKSVLGSPNEFPKGHNETQSTPEPGCHHSAYKSYLDYVYSGGSKQLQFTELLDVHVLAIYYKERQLIEHTTEQIRSRINVSNFAEILERAQTLKSDHLMSMCRHFITNLCEEPHIVVDLVTSLRFRQSFS